MEPNLGLPDDLSLPEPWQRTLTLPGDPALPGLETIREYGLAETLPELDLGDLAVELRLCNYVEGSRATLGAGRWPPVRDQDVRGRPDARSKAVSETGSRWTCERCRSPRPAAPRLRSGSASLGDELARRQNREPTAEGRQRGACGTAGRFVVLARLECSSQVRASLRIGPHAV